MTRPIIERSPGLRAALAIGLVALAGAVTAPVGHRGLWHVCRSVGRTLGAGRWCVVGIGPDSRMWIDLGDAYWTRLIASSYRYEPDFDVVLDTVADIDFALIDCGANFGYWSIRCSAPSAGARPVLAVEALATTYEILDDNCSRNGRRFEVRHRAVTDGSDETVSMWSGRGHAGARAVPARPDAAPVRTVTLDALADELPGGFDRPTVVKLDVEGHEIEALEGAGKLLEGDVLLYYEDHGSDPSCAPTVHLLERLGYRVFHATSAGHIVPIGSVDDARRVKRTPSYGYNFVACRPGSIFDPRFERAAERVGARSLD